MCQDVVRAGDVLNCISVTFMLVDKISDIFQNVIQFNTALQDLIPQLIYDNEFPNGMTIWNWLDKFNWYFTQLLFKYCTVLLTGG